MTIVLDQADNPEEKSSIILHITLLDEDDVTIGSPTTVVWTLTDEDGDTINGREDVAVSPASGQFDVLLQGDDLAITSATGIVRKFLVEWEYVSSYSENHLGKEEITFTINDLVGVT